MKGGETEGTPKGREEDDTSKFILFSLFKGQVEQTYWEKSGPHFASTPIKHTEDDEET